MFFHQLSRFTKAWLTRISPRLNTELVYFVNFKKRINLKSPQTMDEKLQWLKLYRYCNNALTTECADKYAVRNYIKKCGCEEILNELYGVYDKAEDIPWDELPDKFVIKWNFGKGQNIICKDKSKLDIAAATQKMNEWFKSHNTFWLQFAEMQYKNIVPKIVCEKYIETEDGGLPVDYKLYCFNGTADCILVCSDRESGHPKFYFMDKDWNLKRYNKNGKNAPEGFTLPKPENYEKLFYYANVLSKPFPFVRADFYLEKGQVIFGELTFTPNGGVDVNRLKDTQMKFGDMIDIHYTPE